LKRWTVGFSINLYSIARVFYDHGLNTFETIGQRSLQQTGVQSCVEECALYGLLAILCSSVAGLVIVKGIVTVTQLRAVIKAPGVAEN